MAAPERIRLRELAKYYAVANIKARFPRLAPGANDAYNQNVLDIEDLREIKAQAADDRTLTALAQLATQKLGYQRCFISIIDDMYQHFIAEATAATSLALDTSQPQSDLMVGVQSVSLDQKWLPATYTLQQNLFQLDLKEGKGTLETDGMIVYDLASHRLSEQSNLLKAFPESFHGYMEVPLLTSSGYVFGSICVVDSIARVTQNTDLQKLRDIAELIVDHLDTLRLKADYGRAQRLLEGLAHFIEGKQSLSVWSSKTAGQDFIPVVDAGVHDLSYIKPQTDFSRPGMSRTDSLSSAELSLQRYTSPPGDFDYVTPSTSEATEARNVFDDHIDQSSAGAVDPQRAASVIESAETQVRSTTNSAVAEAFSRASNLIRESMSLEATCFLEVPHNERAQLGNRRPSAKTPPIDKGSDPSTDSSSDAATPEELPTVSGKAVMCHRLAFSTKSKSSIARSYTSAKYLTVPASMLKALATKYPRGRIFHFDSKGSISSSEDGPRGTGGSIASDDGGSRKKKLRLSQRLSQLFPEARSLVFVPLYDSDRQHVFAGFLGWTANATRALQTHEVTFIKGFVDSVMCEVQRLEATSTDKAKSDFIASISHELRTPLHGILASTQLLSEGKKLGHQSEFISMIDTCGRTLLDVMDHLLDHAKINHFTQRNRPEKGLLDSKDKDSGAQTFSLVSQVNLATIIEETAASVAASSNQLFQRGRELSRSSHKFDSTAAEVSSVPIILDIHKEQRWSFPTESGSWRRIVMNLVGNSLKYTTSGHISVKLSLTKEDSPATKLEKYMVELRVNDTGQGISEEYLKRRLFTAFAQEDNLSAGTGLGLSLVNNIVKTLNGKIEVQSEVGQGTEILVRIPVTSSPEMPIKEVLDVQAATGLIGMKVAVSGFAEAPASPTGIPGPQVAALLTLKQSLTAIVEDWFQMTIVSSDAEICIVEQSHFENHIKEFDEPRRNILIVSTGLQNLSVEVKRARYVHVAAPIGPTRLARALQSLQKMAKTNIRESDDDDDSTGEALNKVHDLPINTSFSRKSLQEARRENGSEVIVGSKNASTRPRYLQRRSSSDETVIQAAQEAFSKQSGAHPIVLLVDDNDINLRILVTFARRLKTHEILTASNGKEALATFISAFESGKAISTIIMDINMPIMDGFEATRRIRQYESSNKLLGIAATKILALTGLGSEDSQRRIESGGFNQYLRKPVNLKQLQELLHS